MQSRFPHWLGRMALAVALCYFSAPAQAQLGFDASIPLAASTAARQGLVDITVTGKVNDEKGQPLPVPSPFRTSLCTRATTPAC